jgi:hypothetical protein
MNSTSFGSGLPPGPPTCAEAACASSNAAPAATEHQQTLLVVFMFSSLHGVAFLFPQSDPDAYAEGESGFCFHSMRLGNPSVQEAVQESGPPHNLKIC